MAGRYKSKAIFEANSRIQKEQIQLSKIEQELETILGSVNEAINELKVEELQLKAGAAAALAENLGVETEQPSTSARTNLSLTQLPHNRDEDDVSADAVINRQIIDLGMTTRMHNVEEEEDDM